MGTFQIEKFHERLQEPPHPISFSSLQFFSEKHKKVFDKLQIPYQQFLGIVKNCTSCDMRERTCPPTLPKGSLDSKFIIVGRNPGLLEAQNGEPFFPQAPGGRWLDKYLDQLAITRQDCYITNALFCIDGESLVTTSEGLVRLRAIKEGMSVLTKEGRYRKVLGKFGTGKADGLEILLKNGMRIKATGDHLMGSYDSEFEWKSVNDLEVGDFLVLRKGVNSDLDFLKIRDIELKGVKGGFSLPKILDENLAFLMGHLVGDGSYNDRLRVRHYFGLGDVEYLNMIKECNLKVFGWEGNVNKQKEKYELSLDRLDIRRLYLEVGLAYVTCFDKKIPDCVFRSPCSVKWAFLKGLFIADGTVDKKGRVVFYGANQSLVESVQILLYSLEVRSSLRKYRQVNGNDIYQLLIVSGDSLEILRQEFGYWGRKGKRLVIRKGSKIGFLLPKELSEEIYKNTENFVNRSRSAQYRYRYRQTGKMSSSVFKWLKDRYKFEGLEFCQIVTKQKCSLEKYDLQVEDDNSFVANGIVVHNCGGAGTVPDQPSLLETYKCSLWKYREFQYLTNPKFIFLLGNDAVRSFINLEYPSILSFLGRTLLITDFLVPGREVYVFPVIHPGTLLRQPEYKAVLETHLSTVRERFLKNY